MNIKPKLCPFCGEDAARCCVTPSDCFVIRCDWCGVQTTPRNNHVIPWRDWNRRDGEKRPSPEADEHSNHGLM